MSAASTTSAPSAPAFKIRAGQREFERGVEKHRIAGLIARRQYGKTTLAARIALKKMMRTPGHTVIFGSIKLDLGREIVRKESAELQKTFQAMTASIPSRKMLDVVDQKGASVAALNADEFAEIYEASRLELRLYHSRNVYSRTKVVALSADAVGETGDVILDEVGRVKKFRDVWEAILPIIASNPQFRCILTTTPPPDDSHFSYELLAPPIGDFPVSPTGNWYRSELGVWTLRITAWDAFADGIPLFDNDTGDPISPDESRARDHDKDAWDRNYGCKFVLGGTSACGIMQLDTAQRRGIGQCALFLINSDLDFQNALRQMAGLLTGGRIGLGCDPATTTKAASNPTAFAVVEERGIEKIIRALFVWKTADPKLAMERFRQIISTIRFV